MNAGMGGMPAAGARARGYVSEPLPVPIVDLAPTVCLDGGHGCMSVGFSFSQRHGTEPLDSREIT